MSRLVKQGIALLSVFLCGATAFAEDSFTISKLEFVGNSRIDSQALKFQVAAKPGTVTKSTISADVRTLFSTGYFEDVRASIINNTLRFTLIEKPQIRKTFVTGNKAVSEKDLLDVLVITGQRFLDKGQLKAVTEKGIAYYQSRGFYNAAVSYSVVPVADNQVDLTFQITEGDKFKIRRINFTGLKSIDSSDLSSAIQTKRYKWWSSWLMGTGRLSADAIESDRIILRQYLLDHGFLDGTIGAAEIKKVDDRGLELSFPVSEGPVYTLSGLTASGDLIQSEADTLTGIDSKAGDTFSAAKIRADSFKIGDKFTDVGYAFANVVPQTEIERNSAQVRINFAVNKGALTKVNRITVRGNSKTYDNVIRRELKISEQDQYSGSKVKRSEVLLRRLGLFDEVGITSEPTKNADDKVDLTVNVREGSTGSFSAGAGYSTSDGAILTGRFAENNIFGTGRSMNLNSEIGTQNDNFVLSYNDRRFLESRFGLGVDAIHTVRQFEDFDRTQTGGGLKFNYDFEDLWGEAADDYSAGLDYQYLGVNIDNVDPNNASQLVLDQRGKTTSSSITPRLTRNTIDNPLNPTSGSRQQLSVELAGLGGKEKFYLFEARNQWYYPVFKLRGSEWVFSLRTRLGYGDTFDSNKDFPLFRRFFPGGINSVRGFRERSIGPKDAQGNEYGGSKLLVNSAEIIFPLLNSAGLKGVAFYDVGEGFDDNQKISLSDLRSAYGYGIRWTSPLGPIRIEFGFPLDRRDGERSMVTMFSFGAPL